MGMVHDRWTPEELPDDELTRQIQGISPGQWAEMKSAEKKWWALMEQRKLEEEEEMERQALIEQLKGIQGA